MNILIYHMRYHPDATGTAPLVTQLAEDLARKGEHVEVVTSLPHYGRKDVHPDFRDHRGLFHVAENNRVKVWRTPVYVPPNPRVFHRALNYLSYTLFSLLAGIRAQKADVVLAINPPITTTFSAWVVALFHRAPLIVGIQDVWPDCVIRVGQLRNRLLIIFSKWLERLQYWIVQKVIVLSREMKANLQRKQVPPEKIVIIPNWADPDVVTPRSKENGFRRTHGLIDRFVVLFSGNHGYIAALEKVVDAAKLLEHRKDVVFVFAGDGNVKADLIAQAKDANLDNVQFLPTQPEEDWLNMLASADLGLVTLRGDLGELNVPSKVYTLMSAARPILAAVPVDSDVASLVKGARCGIVVSPENPRALADAVLQSVETQPNKLEKMGERGRQHLIQYYARADQVDRYHHLLQEVGLQTG